MKLGELRVRTQKCSLCDWTMPSWLETPEEIKAAFIGHRTSVADCAQAKLISIEGAESVLLKSVAARLQSVCSEHGMPLTVTAAEPSLIQTPDSKCGHT
jgi:hypothetical protein